MLRLYRLTSIVITPARPHHVIAMRLLHGFRSAEFRQATIDYRLPAVRRNRINLQAEG